MAVRSKTDPAVVQKRLQNDFKVLRYLLDNVQTLAVGKLESPAKLSLFYAGYTAMRSIWEVKTNRGTTSTGNAKLDSELQSDPGKFIFRVNMEISHSIGEHTKTLLRVTTFKHWAKLILAHWGT
jgi:hypothetical protein